MKRILLCLLALAAPLAAKNLFDNPSMDTAGGWKGDRKIEKEKEGDKENGFISMKADDKSNVIFNQDVRTNGVNKITITFRYRTKDYAGKGFYMRAERNDRKYSYTRSMNLVADGKWHDFSYTFSDLEKADKVDFKFILEKGDGEVHFDDISAEPK